MTRGPVPKAAGDRQRRNAPTFEQVVLGGGAVAAPVFSQAAWRRLHRESRAWWVAWASSPQAERFGGTDWRRLRMVVLPIVDRFCRAVDEDDAGLVAKLAREIASQEAEFGGTPAARLRLRWELRGGESEAVVAAGEKRDGDVALRSPVKQRRGCEDPRLRLVADGSKGRS